MLVQVRSDFTHLFSNNLRSRRLIRTQPGPPTVCLRQHPHGDFGFRRYACAVQGVPNRLQRNVIRRIAIERHA